MSVIDDLPPLSDVIARHELSTRKSLGQNFLLDLNLTSKIARLAGNLQDHDILEIGPGPGGLTRGLLAEGARHVVVVEKDPRCIPALEEIAAAYPGRLTILQGDALELNVQDYLTPPIKIAANLPYNVGTELLTGWLDHDDWPPFWTSLTLMFQREVAERITALPGSKTYGRLAILAQWRASPQIAMTLPPEAFFPPPKVHSAIVQITPLSAPKSEAPRKLLGQVVAKAFNQRRKMLRASLKGLAPNAEAWITAAGVDPKQRAEELSVEEFCALTRSLVIARANSP